MYYMMEVIREIRKIVLNEHTVLDRGILKLTGIFPAPYLGASVVPALFRPIFNRAAARIPGLKTWAYPAESSATCWTGKCIIAKRCFPTWPVSQGHSDVQKA